MLPDPDEDDGPVPPPPELALVDERLAAWHLARAAGEDTDNPTVLARWRSVISVRAVRGQVTRHGTDRWGGRRYSIYDMVRRYRPSGFEVPGSEPEEMGTDWSQYAEALKYKSLLSVALVANDLGLDISDPDIIHRVIQASRIQDQRDAAIREREEQLAERKEWGHHDPVVYYMRLTDLVKIGTTYSIRQRFQSINPQGVMAVEFGSYDLESCRHNQFEDLRVQGEWFSLKPALADHIATVREDFCRAAGQTVEEWLHEYIPNRC